MWDIQEYSIQRYFISEHMLDILPSALAVSLLLGTAVFASRSVWRPDNIILFSKRENTAYLTYTNNSNLY